ncbi:general transcription factor II-I repeat domain-containing protein 2B-like [Tachypleus tridentatus]|uniref:general transcription factor II-I repeat domain-containing protein 2B-like n=1 Tax=Tachypleus tridentatus TaxID=6853 RepID=UPI003FCFE62C
MNLALSRLISLTTDGPPAMAGGKKGVVTLPEKHVKEDEIQSKTVKLHCTIHQEPLCAKSSEVQEVMEVVAKAVNFILSRGLNHRQFQRLLLEAKADYSDLL